MKTLFRLLCVIWNWRCPAPPVPDLVPPNGAGGADIEAEMIGGPLDGLWTLLVIEPEKGAVIHQEFTRYTHVYSYFDRKWWYCGVKGRVQQECAGK